jgi:hypothetical protein
MTHLTIVAGRTRGANLSAGMNTSGAPATRRVNLMR